MRIQNINFTGNFEGPKVESWINEPYRKKRAEIEAKRIKHTSSKDNVEISHKKNFKLSKPNFAKRTYKSKTKDKNQMFKITKGKSLVTALTLIVSSICAGAALEEKPSQETIQKEPDKTYTLILMEETKLKEEKPVVTSQTHIHRPANNVAEDRIKEFEEKERKEKEESELLRKGLDEKLGAGFSDRLEKLCEDVNCDIKDLVGLMYNESGLNPNTLNERNAVGLIQFMPGTAEAFGTSTSLLQNMTGTEQLDYVEKCIKYWRRAHELPEDKKLSAGELYAMTFVPSYMFDDVLVYRGMWEYDQNTGLDTNNDGNIDKEELAEIVKSKYREYINSLA